MSTVPAEQVRALARLLLDSGDITPQGARLLNAVVDEHDPDLRRPRAAR